MKVFLAGEGKTELGGWFRLPNYRDEAPEVGLLEALLRRVKPDGWTIADGICWKNIPKYRAHERLPSEVGNVLGVVMRARKAGCTAVVFARDRDRDGKREKDVAAGICRARDVVPDFPKVVGGMAIEAIESWVASLKGRKDAESVADPSSLLTDSGLASKRAIVEAADLSKLPVDAKSLRQWLTDAAGIFGVSAATLLGTAKM
ncbi:MAG TPA: hypothetical protein VF524_01775 [Polyangia bacterium]